MKTKLSIYRFLMMLLLTGILLAALPVYASASTAANTQITNTVKVNFSDAAGNEQEEVEATVTITVNLVPSAPIVTVDPITINPATGLIVYDINYTVTSTANGPDTYTISPSSVDTDVGAPGFGGAATVTLGATTVASQVSLGNTTITVPYDAVANDIVNGLDVGHTIIIAPGTVNAEPAVIKSIDESTGPAANTVTITLEDPVTNTHAVGTIIGQQVTVIVTVEAQETINDTTIGTHVVTTTFTSQTEITVTTDSATTTITIVRPVLAVKKYVRNFTSAVVGITAIPVNGATYYETDVNGNPGDTLEYLIVVDNTGANAVEAKNIIIVDTIPQFITYVAGSMKIDSATANAGGSGWTPIADADNDNDAGKYDALTGTVTFYAGTDGIDTTETGGTLQPDQYSFAIFQVTIDN